MTDLLQATGYAAIVYFLFNYLVTFGSGRPLVEWINPGRNYLPLLAMALVGGAYTSIKYASNKHQETPLELLTDLVSKEKAKPEVVGAVSFIIFGMAVMMTFLWCWGFLPRAPQTFNRNPKDLVREFRKALRHYVRWKGGLDYAILCEIRGEQLKIIAEGCDDRDILRGLNRLPGVHTAIDDKHTMKDVEVQKQLWKDMGLSVFQKWPELNQLLSPARQSRIIGLSFDVRYGAIYIEMLEHEVGTGDQPSIGVFLFAACLNEHEVSTLTAARHFSMLHQAIRYIRSGVAKG